MARRNTQADDEGGAIDLTPMLDVVFIMLIFFIVTATFIKEAGIEVDRPEATTSEIKENAKILVAINETGEIWVDRNIVEKEGLERVFSQMHADNPLGALVIQADGEADIELMAAVAEAAKKADITDVSISTDNN